MKIILDRDFYTTDVILVNDKVSKVIGKIEQGDNFYTATVEGYGTLRGGYGFETEARDAIVKKYKELNKIKGGM